MGDRAKTREIRSPRLKAVVMRSGVLSLEEIEAPTPGPGQLLVEPLATGICGSDLSASQHTADFLRMQQQSGDPGALFEPTSRCFPDWES